MRIGKTELKGLISNDELRDGDNVWINGYYDIPYYISKMNDTESNFIQLIFIENNDGFTFQFKDEKFFVPNHDLELYWDRLSCYKEQFNKYGFKRFNSYDVKEFENLIPRMILK